MTIRNYSVARLIGATVLALMVISGNPIPAAGDSYPGNNDTRRADSAGHNYCNESSFTETSVSWYAMSTLDDETDMYDQFHSSCYSWTDVKFRAANLTGDQVGSRICVKANSSSICDSSRVAMDFPQINSKSPTWYRQRIVANHEVGHSTGLGHYNSATNVMKDSLPSGNAAKDLAWRRLEGHDKWHLNNQF